MLGNPPERQLEVYVAPDERGERAGLGLAGPKSLLEEVPIIGWASLSTAQRLNIPPHSHDAFEMIYMIRGSSDWWVGNSVYELTPGDVYVTRPGEHHGLVNAMMTPSEYYWMQVQFRNNGSLPNMSTKDALSLGRDLSAMHLRSFAASREVAHCFQQILEEHRSPDPYSTSFAQAALHALLIRLIRDHMVYARRLERSETTRSTLVREAMDLIDQGLDKPLSSLGITTNARMCDSLFHKRFLTEVGWTPIEYRTRRRIQRAKAMLRENRLTITDIALELGFRTSQYFATVFKKATGISPRQYRDQILQLREPVLSDAMPTDKAQSQSSSILPGSGLT